VVSTGSSETIVLGGGCFWCTEAVFELFKGVIKTVPGYAGGWKNNPSYTLVCSGLTGHAEVLSIEYDPKIIPLETILDIFFTMHDPTTMNRQGADIGTQYRSIILYTTDEQKETSEKFINKIQKDYDKPIVTEVKKLEKFFPAEDYHKNYFDNNPGKGYCTLVISPKVQKVKKKFAELIK
jgi:methionine-S-sulfoxide reductase